MTKQEKKEFIKEYKQLCLKYNCFLSFKSNYKRNITYLAINDITSLTNLDFIDGCISIDGKDAPIYN